MSDEFWALQDNVPDDDIPVAELGDVERPPAARRAPRSRRIAALVLVVALLTAGGVFAAHVANDANGARRKVASGNHGKVKTIGDGQARLNVLAALNTTTASGSFKIEYILTASPGKTPSTTTLPAASCATIYDSSGRSVVLPEPPVSCGNLGSAPNNVTISGEGVVHVTPTAMVTTSNVPNLGEITTRVDGTRVWEDGGANYGMTPSTNTGPGSPLSEFASLVMGTLGRREGAIAMSNMASPTGYLDIAKGAITATSKVGDAVVDGVAVQEYAVTIDTMHALDRPGLTPEEIKATTAALAILKEEGYSATTVRLSIDGLGFIRRAHTVIGFADGGTVTGDTTFSDFGCSSVVLLANGPSIVANPDGCRPSATPSTSVPGSTTTIDPVTATTLDPVTATSTVASAPPTDAASTTSTAVTSSTTAASSTTAGSP